ncbi:segregation/condensation protein A [Candidatus Poribacteria bacterium]|nr:segregation/condensation protein A [Candidatus Poribacteria bacterium]
MAVETSQLELDLGPQFQGPLDLLLHLIQRNEMDIHDVRIAEITGQYLSYLDLMEMLDLDVASEYLVMASTLVYLKSQSMLPAARAAAASGHPDEVREELVRQLLEYKRFKEAATFLDECEAARAEVYTRPPDDEFAANVEHEYHIRATLFDLMAAFQTVIAQHDEFVPDFPDEIEDDPITVEQKIGELVMRLEIEKQMEFSALFLSFQSRLELVCTFLAILELARMQQILATQAARLGPIMIDLNPDRPDISTFQWTQFDGPSDA